MGADGIKISNKHQAVLVSTLGEKSNHWKKVVQAYIDAKKPRNAWGIAHDLDRLGLWRIRLDNPPNTALKDINELRREIGADGPAPLPIGNIKSELRINNGFVHAGGQYYPIACHHLHGVWLHREDWHASTQQLDAITEKYDLVRTAFSLGWYDNFWGDRGVYPVSFTSRLGREIQAWNDYDNVVRDYFAECHKRNLRVIATFGDGQMFGSQEKTNQFTRRVGGLARPFTNIIGLSEWNESWQNWYKPNPTPAEVEEALLFFAEAYGQNHIRGISDSTEETVDLNAWAKDLCLKHGFRLDDDDDKIRHAWGINYDGHGSPPNIYEGFETEPPGFGTSVGEITHPEAMVILALANTMTGYGFTYINKNGIIWDGPIEDGPAFNEVADCRALFPDSLNNYRKLRHGGRSDAPMTTDDFNNIERVDQAIDGNRFFGIAYSHRPTSGPLIPRSKVRLKVQRPLTHEVLFDGELNGGQRLNIKFDRGISFIGEQI